MKTVEFYAFCFRGLVERIPAGELANTILILDQFGSAKATMRELRRQIRALQPPPFKKITFRRSKGESLVQCADIVAGAILRKVAAGDDSFFDLVKDRVTLWPF